ncbi:MAG: hypothetical protein H6708_27580 [Kofleriaceae bacterium]|nr:hypothetical protein [Myxococcales bacterium]MCB9564169.1 hypothetical protein [Kofleriaceae bacterium]
MICRLAPRAPAVCLSLVLVAAAALAGCASSTPGGGHVDAAPPDGAVVDAQVPDATPDAEPCIPDPDGETCNGNDDDCDNRIDEGYVGVGDACEVGIGSCLRAGTTICTTDGTDTVCDAVPGTPTDELCGTSMDEDCDTFVDEGFPDLGMICTAGGGACVASGVIVCSADRLSTECNAMPGTGGVETCNGVDDDCDGSVDEDFQINQPCDGSDGDLCNEGVWVCDGAGGRMCTDTTGTTVDLCGGGDEDCDPASPDGSEDPAIGTLCDGPDSDLCEEGVRSCSNGSLVCSDNTSSTVDLCGNGDEDCDPASPDGSEDPQVGALCDGPDSDLCEEGVKSCSNGSLVCSDNTSSTVDLCGNGDEDCDPASPDGSEDPAVGSLCDGEDSDLCEEGVRSCAGGSLVCSDHTSSTLDLCGNGDEDCDPSSADGSEDPAVGVACDGEDSDLCAEGVRQCSGGALTCSDHTSSTLDLCGNGDEDCDPASADGSEDPLVGVGCDGEDSDLCVEGTRQCTNGALSCSDHTSSTLDLCGNGDEDCDPASPDGSEDARVGVACDGNDGDVCVEGTNQCTAGALTCSDTTGTTFETCSGNAADEDCDGLVDEGFNRNDNPACPTYTLGTISGDTGAQVLTDTWYDEEFDVVHVTENDSSFGGVYLSATISLYSPPGVDFDLYVRCGNCSGGSAWQSSTTHGLTGHTDTVYIRGDDDWLSGETDDFDMIIEVRHYSSNRCAYWNLTVTGNTSVSNVTCDI